MITTPLDINKKNGEFTFLTLRIMGQKENGITDGLGVTIVSTLGETLKNVWE